MTLTALLDLFRHRREGATGVWRLGQEPYRTVFFDAGDIVFAQSTFPADRLTSLLVEKGKLTQAQLDYALANLKQGMSIGKNLIEMGFITQRDLLDMARLQVERVVYGAMETPDEKPEFRERELESSVVRLPMDTSLLLLNGLLNLKDRESILETLGPLNQVVVLHGRQLGQVTLPADLAKLTPFLDGTHTLLELSRESLTEPMRLGAFALFLREMGFAKLHEMPPMDKLALAEVLSGEPEPLSAALPPAAPSEPPIDTVPSLFSTIEDAARPTTNLEHLSRAFDSLDEREALPSPSDSPLEEVDDASGDELDVDPQTGFTAESGQAILPTPQFELPVIPEEEEPRITLGPETVPPVELPEAVRGELEEPEDMETSEVKVRGGVLKWLLLAAAILLLAGGGTWALRRTRRPSSDLQSSKPTPLVTKPEAKPVEVPPQMAVPPPPTAPEPQPLDASPAGRLAALQRGDMVLALAQGAKLLEERPKTSWALRLELACQPETVKRAVELFKGEQADLFIRPMLLRDGRDCYQIFYGEFPSAAAAEKQAPRLPAAFRNDGNRPRPYRMDAIPSKQ
ncbi:DUF4388 domain-containing protein [Holophaga foetida]|uniref:DUF4388 domain-containing protein n=1 Tax=Holophaga foetida TaxID=35839 RepID=UPI000247534F|nr:DUF4388 domain-containing protein [Holophaga foetida]